jgi:hypothetical protein
MRSILGGGACGTGFSVLFGVDLRMEEVVFLLALWII